MRTGERLVEEVVVVEGDAAGAVAGAVPSEPTQFGVMDHVLARFVKARKESSLQFGQE